MLYIVTFTYIFKITKFLEIIFTIFKMVRANEKISSTTFVEIDISHRMAPLRMLYIVTFTYIFKVTKFLDIIYLIFGKWWEIAIIAQAHLL